MKGPFDVLGFYAALDSERRARRLNWKEISAQTKVSSSTLSRMAQGKRPDVDGLASLLAWSGLNIDDFIRRDEAPLAIAAGSASGDGGTKNEPSSIARISAILRADENLSSESAIALDEMLKATYERLRTD